MKERRKGMLDSLIRAIASGYTDFERSAAAGRGRAAGLLGLLVAVG